MPPKSKLMAFAPSDLATYYRNPNVGNVPVIRASLQAHGQYKPIVVNKGTHTGRPNEVLAGNHTLMAYRDAAEAEPNNPAWRTIDAYVIDVDNDRAARIVLVDNKSAEEGDGYDKQTLADLLGDLDGDFTGTAFTEDEYSDILAGLEELLPDALDLADDNVIPKPPRTGEDGLIASTDIDTQASTYVDASTRLVVLTLPINQFIWAQEVFTKIREEKGIDSNTGVVLELLAAWIGDEVPAAPAGAPDTEEEVL